MQLLMRPAVLSLPRRDRGFTLIEIAIALFIITLILGSLLVPLTTQVAQRKTSDTQKTLEEIKEALAGFAVSNGRLPCPASATSNGVESFVGAVGASACTSPWNGYVPAATLGLQTTVVAPAGLGRPLTDPPQPGYAIDAWGTPIRYAVTMANSNAFTTTNGMRTQGLTALLPDLYVCPTSTGISGSPPTCSPYLTNSAAAVIYSLGPNWATGGTGADEAANPNPNSTNNDRAFVYHVRSDSVAPNGEFDDIVTWLSENVLYNRMVAAGQLP